MVDDVELSWVAWIDPEDISKDDVVPILSSEIMVNARAWAMQKSNLFNEPRLEARRTAQIRRKTGASSPAAADPRRATSRGQGGRDDPSRSFGPAKNAARGASAPRQKSTFPFIF